jgi:hypothetical protein
VCSSPAGSVTPAAYRPGSPGSDGRASQARLSGRTTLKPTARVYAPSAARPTLASVLPPIENRDPGDETAEDE